MKSGIYKITSPIGSVYVGKSNDIDRRWEDYSFGHCKNQTTLYLSLVRYGYLNHKFEIVEDIDPSSDDTFFLERELFYWNKYKNEGSIMLNKNKPYRGIVIKERKKTKLEVKASKPITQFTKEGRFIKVWSSTVEASEGLRISRATIFSAIKKDYIVINKFRFREGIVEKDIIVKPKSYTKNRSKIRYKVNRFGVLQYSKEGELIKEWESSKEVESNLGIKFYYINKALNPNVPYITSGGFVWRRAPVSVGVLKVN